MAAVTKNRNFFNCPLIYPPELEIKETTDTASSASFLELGESFYSPGPLACFSDKDDVSRHQNNYYWPLHSETIAICKRLYSDTKILSKNILSLQRR
jgi:hypothetical protein